MRRPDPEDARSWLWRPQQHSGARGSLAEITTTVHRRFQVGEGRDLQSGWAPRLGGTQTCCSADRDRIAAQGHSRCRLTWRITLPTGADPTARRTCSSDKHHTTPVEPSANPRNSEMAGFRGLVGHRRPGGAVACCLSPFRRRRVEDLVLSGGRVGTECPQC